jgi:hypothetical protein
MAFGFFGTFTTGQFNELADFSKIQETDIQDRMSWLSRQLELNGVFTTEYDDETNFPVSFSCDPPHSYGAKLLQAYKILGGQPERDMLLRTSDKPVYLTRGVNISHDKSETNSGYSDSFSNGRKYRGNQRFDRDLGLRVQRLKDWQLEAIKRKREHLEFKIKRCLDYSDQLQLELAVLKRMTTDGTNRSVGDQIGDIETQMFTSGAMNVVNNLLDIFGLGIGKVADKAFPDDLDDDTLRSDSPEKKA